MTGRPAPFFRAVSRRGRLLRAALLRAAGGVLACAVCALPLRMAAEESAAAMDRSTAEQLERYQDPERLWGSGVEAVIEKAYRASFKTLIIGGRVMNLRMPFAENNERTELTDQGWEVLGGGKANPAFLWEAIGEILAADDFSRYVAALGDSREKVVIFDIPARAWSVSTDLFDIARMKAGAYRGLPHRPYVLVSGRGILESDVYNYLYCVGWTGIDCSGFVWYVLSTVAKEAGIDLGATLRRVIGSPRGRDVSWYVGTAFFNSANRELITVPDEARNLRPLDVILFRGADGAMVHSAIIQSVNLETGVIRYLQSTDEAPYGERGAHESFIRFDPAAADVSLADSAVMWTQSRYPPFPGEKASPFSNDGARYRAFPEHGGGKVVRLRIMADIAARLSRRRG
ncbi:MAG: peptidoglycan endopeptidase [Spirochaetaceae bacterium]|jgi:cell wall-associated NlpC family hydrolase|nr:peptidoglycan endopeptidase [Spirochaetaceae bacterium]